jgi:hypothetical protein
MMYHLYKTTEGKDAVLLEKEDGSSISFLFDPENTDYAAYLKWLSEGNQPTPADEVTE